MFEERRSPATLALPLAVALLLPGCGNRTAPQHDDADIYLMQSIADQGQASEEDVELLLLKLTAGRPEERAVAAYTIGAVRAEAAAEPLVELARSDENADVRINAARALGRVHPPGAGEALIGLLRDPDPAIRGAALNGLATPAYADACRDLCAWMKNAGDDLRPVAVDALVTMAGACGSDCLASVADDPLAEIRSLIAFGLGKSGDPGALDVLASLLRDPEPTVRANAAQAMGMIGAAAARPHLESATTDEYGIVQDAAKDALGKLPG